MGWRGANPDEKPPADLGDLSAAGAHNRGSRFSSGFGFIRMKLPRESAYLFCHRRDADLEEILREILRANP